MDVSLIANEVVDSMLKRGEKGGAVMLCELDIGKAYGHINWNYPLLVLQRMRFGSKWIGWIKMVNCLPC